MVDWHAVMQFGGQHPGGLGVPAVGMAFPGYVAQPQLGLGNSEMTWYAESSLHNCIMAGRFLVLPWILHGPGMCCQCPIKWQIDASDEVDDCHWCNEIIVIQLFQKIKIQKRNRLLIFLFYKHNGALNCRVIVFYIS